MTNGDPVLFAAMSTEAGPTYGFACTACGRHQADTACASCAKPAKRPRRPARKTTAKR